MQITTSTNKTFDILFISTLLRAGNRLMIELKDERMLSEIAADFDGVETITKTDDIKPNVKEVYDGFSNLVHIQRNRETGTVRMMLERIENNS